MATNHLFPEKEEAESNNVLKYFMWGYQTHTRITMSTAADRLFDALSTGLSPTVHLVGFLETEAQQFHPICVEPEDGDFSPDIFVGVKALAATFRATPDGSMYIHPSKAVADKYEERDRRYYLKKALHTILVERGIHSGTTAFCGYPARVGEFLVIPVLQLNTWAYEALPRLQMDHLVGQRPAFCRSLGDALVEVFLEECSKNLRQPEPGADYETVCPDVWEALRQAATKFMYAASSAGANIVGLHSLYDACNGVASLNYEGIEGLGRLVVAKRRNSDVNTTIEMRKPVSLSNYRAVRKLLELSAPGQALLSDSAEVYGLGHVLSSYSVSMQNVFEVEFFGHYQWRLMHAGQSLMEVAYDRPRLPKNRLPRDRFEPLVRRLFPSTRSIDLDNLWNLVGAAIEQRHGTMLVISDCAEAEADRLSNQSTVISPLRLTPEIMRSVSKIDGAVLIDPQCLCFAIGVILDGMGSKNGDPARGARFNSAIRYVETKAPQKILAIVVSEDGSVDLVPNLRPQIDRESIASQLAELAAVAGVETLEMKRYYRLMKWFESHRFYLSAGNCKQLNQLRETILERHHAGHTGMVIINPDFAPDPEMNDEYFLPKKKTPESVGIA